MIPDIRYFRFLTEKRSLSSRLQILDTETESDLVDFEEEYLRVKLYCADVSAMPVGGTIQPRVNGLPCYDSDGELISLDIPTEGFCWHINFAAGHRYLSFALSAPATDDIDLVVTAYGLVES